MAEKKVFFFMRKAVGQVSAYEIEEYFPGLKYAKCDGLLDKGKRTDVYTESYAESDTLRVWFGDSIAREATTITLTLYFVGASRIDSYNAFYRYITSGEIDYWDTARLKLARMVFIDSSSPKEEVYKGSTPYIAVDFKFQNIWGECKDCNENGYLM